MDPASKPDGEEQAAARSCHCYCCGAERESAEQLALCAGCKTARYCSHACQKQHWKDHKLYCKHVASGGASSVALDASTYWEKIAACDPAARALARAIGIDLAVPSGLAMPMRRLVVTGKDTAENLALFFGSGWRESTRDLHADLRLEVLLAPPPGSPMHKYAEGLRLDAGCPRPWTPRAADADEARHVAKIRAMQDAIRRHVGARGVENLTGQDMQDVLVQQCGSNWVTEYKTYQHAANSMYQGV
ncbi:hypothetical protein SLS62_007135 [Diatrype stigma]|uniref:MYND-type domain-containing protein n=1 Tax=Diatrype stigma TaxID=117547 RepID=A0AAN9YQJ5_9PEZI